MAMPRQREESRAGQGLLQPRLDTLFVSSRRASTFKHQATYNRLVWIFDSILSLDHGTSSFSILILNKGRGLFEKPLPFRVIVERQVLMVNLLSMLSEGMEALTQREFVYYLLELFFNYREQSQGVS